MHESKVSKYAGGLTGLSPRNNIVASKNRSNISSTYPRNNYLSRFEAGETPCHSCRQRLILEITTHRSFHFRIFESLTTIFRIDSPSRKMIESNPPRDSLASQEIAVEGVR